MIVDEKYNAFAFSIAKCILLLLFLLRIKASTIESLSRMHHFDIGNRQ